MKKTILIPTDFSIESLRLVKHAIEHTRSEVLEIVLLYCSDLPDSITELLFYSPVETLDQMMSDDFKEACSILQNKYAAEHLKIRAEIFHSRSTSDFNRFAKDHHIEEIFLPGKYTFKLKNNAFDPISMLRKSKVKVTEIDWTEKKAVPEKGLVAELFLN